MGRLDGQRAVVTGAGSGIGQAVVRRFLDEGAQVVAVVRNPAERPGLEAEGAAVLVGDVSRYETAERAVALAQERFGGLDCYVANAGLWDFHKRLEKQSLEELTHAYGEIFGVNFLGALYGARAAIGPLRESRGNIIVTGSNACFRAGGGGVIYTASKFALRGLVMQLAKEFAPDVRVNGVAPPSSPVTNFPALPAALSVGDEPTRATLAEAMASPSSGQATTIMLDQSMPAQEGGKTRLANVVGALRSHWVLRVASIPEFRITPMFLMTVWPYP